MATVRIDLTSQNTAQREILQLRGEMTRLNAQIAQNNRLASEADQATRTRLRGSNQRIRAEQGLLRVQQQRASLNLANLRQEARELQQATRSTRRFSGVVRDLGTHLGALGISVLASEVAQFTREIFQASVQIDSYRRALGALEGSAVVAGQRLRELQDLADLPALTFRQAVDGAVALRAIGVEAETTTRILTELSNAAAFTGGAGEFQRGLLGFRQLLQRGRLSQEELNQLTENIGLASRVIREEFGTVLAEDIQEQLDQSGQSIDDFVERVLTGFERLDRFPLDAPSVKLENLSNAFFEFQAAIGERLLPIVGAAAEGLTNFFDRFTEWIQNTDDATQSLAAFTEAILTADSAIARDDALQERIRFLRQYVRELENARRNRGIFDARGRSRLGSEIQREQAELERLQQIEAGDPEGIQRLRTELSGLNDDLAEVQQTQTDVENTITRLARGDERRRVTVERSFAIRRERLNEEEAAILSQIDLRESELRIAEEAAQGTADAERERLAALENTTEGVENLSLSLARAAAESRRFQSALENAQNVGDSAAALQNTIAALEREQAAEEAFARDSITNQERLETELFNIADAYNRARAEARARHEARIQQAVGETRDARIRAAERTRDVELAAFDAAASAGDRYADALRAISDAGNRLEFQRLVDRLQDQGLSFEQALTQAQRYIAVINEISSTTTRADRVYGQFNATLGQEDTGNYFTNILSGFRQITALFEESEARLEQAEFRSQQNEERAFAARPGRDVLGDIQQEARAQGVDFLLNQRRQQIRELGQSAAQIERTIDGALTRIGSRLADTFVNVLVDGTASLQDFGREFLAFSVRILARTAIEIAQQKALQAEIARTNALRTAGLVASVSNPASALSLLSFLIPTGGQLFHNPVSDRIAARGGRQAARFLHADRETQVRNSRDFVDYFVPDFFREFARLGLQAGAAASAPVTTPVTQPASQAESGGRKLEELVKALQADIARTNALRTAVNVSNPTSLLSLLSFLIPSGGQLFHNPVSDRLALQGGRQAARFLQADRETQVRNSQDFVDNFVPGFFRDFARLGLQAGAVASAGQAEGGRTPQQIVIPVNIGGRTVEEFVVELDNMEQSNQIVRRRKSSSLV